MTVSESSAGSSDAGTKKRRALSSIGFPYFDLDDAVEIVRAIHNNAGNQCTIDQLAGYLKQTTTSGAFREKVRTAKIFGVVEGSVRLTAIGRLIVDPQRERAGKAQAFLAVPLYSAIHEKYKGNTLPPDVGLEREMVLLGISEKQKAKARQAFQRSAQQAGFFDQGKDRLVMPAGVGPVQSAGSAVRIPSRPQDDPAIDPHGPARIQMLLKLLPDAGESWAEDKQDAWLDLMRDALRSSYTSEDQQG